MTSVPQAAHVRDVFLNPETGLLAAPRNQDKKKLYLELSTIDAAVSSEVAEAVASGGFGRLRRCALLSKTPNPFHPRTPGRISDC